MIRTPLRKKRATPRRGRLRDPQYLAWIREQPCYLCCYLTFKAHALTEALAGIGGILASELFPKSIMPARQESPTEAAHIGTRGLGQKCSDRETLPLCGVEHHRIGAYSHHKLGKRFAEFHGIDIGAAVAQYNEAYERSKQRVSVAHNSE